MAIDETSSATERPKTMLYKPAYKKSSFQVRKPIRSFRDLEVYQRASGCATEVIVKVSPLLGQGDCLIRSKLLECVLHIPEAIAAAHSRRFETGSQDNLLEGALEGCNKAVVYLEQARDIFIKGIEGRALCEDLIKRYILLRRKTFNLYKAWRKFSSRQEPACGLRWVGLGETRNQKPEHRNQSRESREMEEFRFDFESLKVYQKSLDFID